MSGEGAEKWQRRGEDAWRSLLGRFESSGQSVSAFCAREGVGVANFYRWRAKLRGDAMSPARSVESEPGLFVDAGSVSINSTRRTGLDLRLDLGEGWSLHLVRN